MSCLKLLAQRIWIVRSRLQEANSFSAAKISTSRRTAVGAEGISSTLKLFGMIAIRGTNCADDFVVRPS